jgi:glycosyltransferase involved in cell wall biosynthesis/SAM-dependent methyltransferase
MKKVAIVVQRCHESIVGGSESLAWQYASLLSGAYEVDVLTTTAVDTAYWTNALPAGMETRAGINIHRFHVDIGYSLYRGELFERMLEDFRKHRAGRRARAGGACHIPWSIPLQEEFIRHIGPYSQTLVRYIRERWIDYHAIIFITYLYPTAYFGLLEVPPRHHALFAPTLHDEEPAYLSAYGHAARRARMLIWLSAGERRLGQDLWGDLPGRIVGMSIDAEPRQPARLDHPYLLYCGRIDPNKGCGTLFDYFTRFKANHPSNLRLLLTGKDEMPVPAHPDIEFRGFVSAEEKFSLMAGATVYMMPSGKESFSIVTLEAMAQRTPVLASSACEVIVDHIAQSRGGLLYHDYESFAAALNRMLSDPKTRSDMGERGREYVVSRFRPETVRAALIEAVESCSDMAGNTTATDDLSSRPPQNVTRPATEPPRSKRRDNSPPLPLPAGWTEEALRDLVVSILVEDGPPEEMRAYANGDFRRFVYTLGLVPETPGLSVLELGANPYFTTTLIQKFRDVRLHLANFFGEGQRDRTQKVTIRQTGEALTYTYEHFNIEREVFPYADDSFDVVLFCEIIEHLLFDPVHALLEIKRVLKPGGLLVLTTPNVVRFDNVCKVVAGENIYDPYSGYGPYGRHNREYSSQEIGQLLTANGFHIRALFTADVDEARTGRDAAGAALDHLVGHRRSDLGQYIFCQAAINRDSKQVPPARPAWLYRSFHNSAQQ